MNNHHDTDGYARPSISIHGSLAELTEVTKIKQRPSIAWEGSKPS